MTATGDPSEGMNDHMPQTLSMWGVDIVAQIRRYATLIPETLTPAHQEQTVLALRIKETAQTSPEDGHPYLISEGDAERLRDLLDWATDRGYLPPRRFVVEDPHSDEVTL